MLSPGYLLYNVLTWAIAPLIILGAAARGRLRGNWDQRFGLGRLPGVDGRPRIWVHGVSVGEIGVAEAVIAAIRKQNPAAGLWMSTTTDTGRQVAEKAGLGCPVITFPFDVYGSPGRALDRLQPDVIVLLETEIWPNFLRAAHRRGVRVMLANGRISERSVGRYRKARFFFSEVLQYMDRLVMIRQEDAERIVSMGAEPARVRVGGNAKYDRLIAKADPARRDALRAETGLAPGRPVIAAGSTREGEERVILEAFVGLKMRFPGAHLILAPRHVTRAVEIEALIRERGLAFSRRSDGPHNGSAPDVTLVDVIGELFFLYGLATAAFCGGSLFPFGGQNPLEPAVWGVPVLFGPHMADFLDAKSVLDSAGAGKVVKDAAELENELAGFLADPARVEKQGGAARKALESHQGASERLAAEALDLWAAADREFSSGNE